MGLKPLIDGTINLPNRLPLRFVLIVPLMLLLTGAVGVVGYLSFRNGQRAVNDVATQLRDAIVHQIEEKLNTSTKAAHTVNRLNAKRVNQGLQLGLLSQAIASNIISQFDYQRKSEASSIFR